MYRKSISYVALYATRKIDVEMKRTKFEKTETLEDMHAHVHLGKTFKK
jgi:hypothetical protein